ncbi:hypothetical protein MIR68_001018 [Amoeboaphelidium protococcarum]|nr:hypothetical protein MIR68_001018 [Amoeboaphelidium protococcarum]
MITRQVKIVKPFKAQRSDELSVQQGEMVTLLQKINEDWYLIKRGGIDSEQVGLVPADCIQLNFEENDGDSYDQCPSPSETQLQKNDSSDDDQLNTAQLTEIMLRINTLPTPLYDHGSQPLQSAPIQASAKQQSHNLGQLSQNSRDGAGVRVNNSAPSSPVRKGQNNSDSNDADRIIIRGFLSLQFGDSMRKVSQQQQSEDGAAWSQQKFYCTFDGVIFQYYASLTAPSPAGELKSSTFQSVNSIQYLDKVTNEQKTMSTFELVYLDESDVTQRVWIDCGDDDNLQKPADQWISSLKDSIAKRRPSMNNPLEQKGWLRRVNDGIGSDWRKRYVVMRYGKLEMYKNSDLSQSRNNRADEVMDMATCSVKQCSKYPLRFEVITPRKCYTFQTESVNECYAWVRCTRSNIEWAIKNIQSYGHQSRSASDASSRSVSNREVLDLISVNSDQPLLCADCGCQYPEWASVNLGVALCIECSGIHRSLGVYISKVRSLQLDDWDHYSVRMMSIMANGMANSVYEASPITDHVKPCLEDVRSSKEKFIRDKYIIKKFKSNKCVLSGDYGALSLSQHNMNGSGDDPILLSVLLCVVCMNGGSSALQDVLQLVWHGADINFKYDKYTDAQLHAEDICIPHGSTPLHCAVRNADLMLVNYLLLNGADINLRDVDEQTPVDLANHQSKAADSLKRLLKAHCDKERKQSDVGSGDRSNSQHPTDLQAYLMVKDNGKSGKFKRKWLHFKIESSNGDKEENYIGSVSIYKNSSSRESETTINLAECIDVKSCPPDDGIVINGASWAYQIELHTWSSIHYIAFQSMEDAVQWLESLQKIIGNEKENDLSVQSPSSKSYNAGPTTVFGVDLEQCASRKQGSRDKGVPLFVVKCIKMLDSLVQECDYIGMLFKGEIAGISQSQILGLMKDMKDSFDASDEETDLQLFMSHWKFKFGDTESTQLSFMRSLSMLVLNYFSSLPMPLLDAKFSDHTADVMVKLRSKDKELINLSDDPSIESVASLLAKLSQSHSNTCKVLFKHLHRLWLQQSSVNQENNYARELAFIWTKGLFSGASVSSKSSTTSRKSEYKYQVYLVEYFILHADKVFEKTGRPIPNNEDQGSESEHHQHQTLFPVDVFIHEDGQQVISQRIAQRCDASELVQKVVKLMQVAPGMSLRDFALFEINDGMERIVHADECVFDIVQSWPSPAGKKLMFKPTSLVSSIYKQQQKQLNSSVLMSGWLMKEGVSVRSWKSRYFVLKGDYLFYFKDTECCKDTLIGKIQYKKSLVYELRPSSLEEGDSLNKDGCDHLAASGLKYGFCLKFPDAPSRYFCSDSEREVKDWITIFMRCNDSVQSKFFNTNSSAVKTTTSTPSLSRQTVVKPQLSLQSMPSVSRSPLPSPPKDVIQYL